MKFIFGPVKYFESIPEAVKQTGVNIANNAGIQEGIIFGISSYV